MNLAPVTLFTYNRLWHTQQTVESLEKNVLAAETEFFVFSDGPREEVDKEKVRSVREYLKTIDGFKEVTVIERDRNLGLAQSIITGVTEIVKKFGRIIVLEDDMVTSPYFLRFMNEALAFYEKEAKVISIHGYIYPIKATLPETFFVKYTGCWGWATWKRGWDLFEPDGRKLLRELEEKKLTEKFDINGSYPFTQMLRDQTKGKNNSWAIRWQASAFLKGGLTLFPGRSLVKNIGHDASGSHCGTTDRYDVRLSDMPVQVTNVPVEENHAALKELEGYFRTIMPNRIVRGLVNIVSMFKGTANSLNCYFDGGMSVNRFDHFKHVCYKRDIPSEIFQKLIGLYQSAYCVKEYFQLYKPGDALNAFVIYSDASEPIHVIIFTIAGKEVTVLNELFDIENEYIEYYSGFIFKHYAHVNTINVNRIKWRSEDLSYPYLIWNTSEDIVLQLPKSIEDYRAQLGKQTQKHIKYYINRLGRDHGDFTFRVTASNEVDSSSIIRIIEMNRLRMASKHMVSGIDHAYEKNIIEFSKKYGLIGTLAVGDKIIAGAICYEVGDHSYLHVIAHDPAYNKYNAGQVCLYLTIKTLIEREKRVFHMLWGESEYKYRFLGVKQKLSFVRIYRSPLSRHIGIMNHMIAHFKNYFVLRCVAPFLAPVRKMMPFLRTIKNAMFLFFTLNWKELYVRTCVALGHIDLGMTSLDELNLSAERSNFYSDSRCAELDTVLATLRISSSDAVIDFGCGKGGALITLSRYPFSKITGVEISDRLVVIARENLRKLRLRNVTVVHSDAADFRDLDDYNIVYLFNPFPCPVMQSVMDNLRKSIERKPRKVTIIYLNPVCHDELVSDSLFVKRREFDHPSHKYYIYSNQP